MSVQIDLKSLIPKTELNSKLWDTEGNLKSEIRDKLLVIAEDFFCELDTPWAELEDIRLTGSSANYNWSKYSDIDVHLVVDYSMVDKNEDFVEAYFSARKNLWNNGHDITIFGHDVEVYVEDANGNHISSGIYSVMLDEWIKKPSQVTAHIDKKAIEKKSQIIIRLFNDVVIDKFNKKDYAGAVKSAEKMSKKLKKMRQAGLDARGEYSTENLTYKVLRRNGLLKKLWDTKINAYDQMMSVKK